MPDGTATARRCVLPFAIALLFFVGGCGGNDTEAKPESSEGAEIIDVATIGLTQAEEWSLFADRWADTALDESNTVGELLNDPRDLRRLVAGRAPMLRERVLEALSALGPRCAALESEVPPAPPELDEAAASLARACTRFARARVDLADGLDGGDREIVDRGLRRLAGGVNAIAEAKQAISPRLG